MDRVFLGCSSEVNPPVHFDFAMVLIFLYERTGNLLAPILAHSFFNTANFLALIYQRELAEFFKVQS